MAAKISNDDEAIAEINIVPFVDIILVVLIIFMVTTPLIMKPSIKVKLPKAASSEKTTPSQFNITITSKGAFLLNGKIAVIDEIAKYAKEQAAKSPDTQAIISADEAAMHGSLMSVIDAVKSQGIEKFAITTDKK